MNADPLKVALVDSVLCSTSSSIYALRLAAGLMERGHQVGLFCAANHLASDTQAMGLEVSAERQGYDMQEPKAKWLCGILSEWEPNIVHFCSIRMAPKLMQKASGKGFPVAATSHEPSDRDLSALRRCAGPLAVVAPTQQVRQNLVNVGRITKESIAVIPFGVPPVEREPRPISPESPVVVAIGEPPEEFYEMLLNAASILVKTHPGIKVVLTSPLADVPKLRKMTKEKELEDVVFVATKTGSFFNILSAADVCVAAGAGHTFSPVAVEALAHGIPLVVSNGPGHMEVITHDLNGLVFEQDSTAEMARTVERMLSEPTTARRLSVASRETAQKTFPMQKFIDGIEKLYSNLLNPE